MAIAAILTIVIPVVFIAILVSVASSKRLRDQQVTSSDGHVVPENQDVTCSRYGHRHSREEASNTAEYGSRYIVHNDPEEGYVVLNGIKHRITDCKNL